VQLWVGEMQEEGLSPSRIRQAVIVLSQALDAAMRDGRVARNATKGVKLPRLQRVEAAYLDPGQVEAIARVMPDGYDVLVRVLGTVGLRFGEAAALQRRHVDLLRRRLRVEQSLAEVGGVLRLGPTKTHAVRTVPLPASLAKALEEHLQKNVPVHADAWVFHGPKGGALRHSAFYGRVWTPTLRRLGVDHVGIHVLRHSAVAAMISAGASPKAVQQVMGHRSVAFTLTVYGHLLDADLDDLAERLDALPRHIQRPVHGLAT
jgi:integrase